MSGSSNFVQFNPTKTNMATDGAYDGSTIQQNGVPLGGIADPTMHNKMFYQWSTFIAAFCQVLANQGFTVSDSSIAALETILGQVLLTTATAPMQISSGVVSINAAYGGFVPVGGIITWSGSIVSIPANWHLCDGTNGTPDLRNVFQMGAGSTYAVGAAGGEASHILTQNEMPAHVHASAGIYTNNHTASTIVAGPSNIAGQVDNYDGTNTGTTGGGAAHNTLPPYYALAFIMRIS